MKFSVKMRCDSLNSGVENDRRGSSNLRMSARRLVCWRISCDIKRAGVGC